MIVNSPRLTHRLHFWREQMMDDEKQVNHQTKVLKFRDDEDSTRSSRIGGSTRKATFQL